ncbi:MAG: Rpn family recombination-promoting nuclease/putative transposase [bacterium]|nr:Rpn family recombination-promoting nuclease/putative transposase [bacterium]
MDKLYKSHDGFFRKLMSERQTAQDYLAAFLPENLKDAIDFNTLEQDTDSYIDEKLKASMSDVVFKADTRQGFGINFCFLFEHKSYIDDKAPFQILHYISSAMLKRAINKEEQRLIIPILFYHGEAPWEYESIGDKFSALDKVLKVYLPRFDYLFHNYQAKPDEEIKQASNPKLTAALIAMKHFYEQGYLLKQMQFLLLHATDEHGNLYKPLLVYLFDKLPDQMDAIQKAMEDLPPPVKTEAMSILDACEARGKAEGKAEGYSEKTLRTCINMIQDEFDNATICRVLEVDDAYVDEVREQLKNEGREA